MTHCTHKENLGGDNQPFIWSCKKGWGWVGKDCENTCMYKDMPNKIVEKEQLNFICKSCDTPCKIEVFDYSEFEPTYCPFGTKKQDWKRYKKDKYTIALSKKQIEYLERFLSSSELCKLDIKILKKLRGAICEKS